MEDLKQSFYFICSLFGKNFKNAPFVVVVEDLFSLFHFKTKVRVRYRKAGFEIVSLFSGCR